ncbi:VOC family protein [Exilibacterium tricleocarpae]|uniref:VOC family protein n=1 Tax=Exilibacterium tricleocarpae TaxID=2591008 RepID=A0A545TV94_9GAMM|nr:VOC family protein [Exilibacterium tricleocarpae]TQV81139.1 VOC family protein [Exilibacterium tricleocarpae]
MRVEMDHLVIGAASLKQGVDYVKDLLGVDIPYGGAHIKMGTHNHLMQLGNHTFLEVIAIDHDLESPDHPRWYGLDDPFVRQQIDIEPTLLTWVINTKNLIELGKRAVFSLGRAELISRGELSWYFGLPEDGRLLAGGMLPYAIEWQTDIHPSLDMADLGCKLRGLEIYHPNSLWLKHALESVGASGLVEVKDLPKNVTPCLIAHISTPLGIRKLSSHRVFNKAM